MYVSFKQLLFFIYDPGSGGVIENVMSAWYPKMPVENNAQRMIAFMQAGCKLWVVVQCSVGTYHYGVLFSTPFVYKRAGLLTRDLVATPVFRRDETVVCLCP